MVYMSPMEATPQGYKYLGCRNCWLEATQPELYKQSLKENNPIRSIKIGRSWDLYVDDKLKITWDIDSSD